VLCFEFFVNGFEKNVFFVLKTENRYQMRLKLSGLKAFNTCYCLIWLKDVWHASFCDNHLYCPSNFLLNDDDDFLHLVFSIKAYMLPISQF
jgi:hypothetical protein